jgi:hypothetical protein
MIMPTPVVEEGFFAFAQIDSNVVTTRPMPPPAAWSAVDIPSTKSSTKVVRADGNKPRLSSKLLTKKTVKAIVKRNDTIVKLNEDVFCP